MISSRPTIPLLVHEDCMEGVQLDLAKQQASLSKIASNTDEAARTLGDIEDGVLRNISEATTTIEMETSSIMTSSSNTATQLGTIKTDTSSLSSSVGLPADASTSNTVIGLLKSIANKL